MSGYDDSKKNQELIELVVNLFMSATFISKLLLRALASHESNHLELTEYDLRVSEVRSAALLHRLLNPDFVDCLHKLGIEDVVDMGAILDKHQLRLPSNPTFILPHSEEKFEEVLRLHRGDLEMGDDHFNTLLQLFHKASPATGEPNPKVVTGLSREQLEEKHGHELNNIFGELNESQEEGGFPEDTSS